MTGNLDSVPRLSLLAAAALLGAHAFAGEVRHGTEGHAQNPVWSADGKRLAFEVNAYGDSGINLFFSDVNGDIAKDAKKVGLPGGGGSFGGKNQVVVNPAWHPQGLAIFEGSNQGGKFRLYFVPPGGAAPAEMLSKDKAPGDLTFPTISLDGNTLGYVSDHTGNGDIYTWNRASDQITQITRSSSAEMFPQFSLDGTRVLFSRKVNDTEDIFEHFVADGRETPLAGGGGDQTRPNYATANKVVYFTSERGDDEWDLAVVNSGGSGKKILARDVRLPVRARPALSPDGHWVAFCYSDPGKGNAVQLVNVDGEHKVSIPVDHVACGEPQVALQAGRTLLAYTALPAAEADWRLLYVMDISNSL